MRRLSLALLLLSACATPQGLWYASGLYSDDVLKQATAIVEAAKRVTPDEKGYLAQGGMIWIEPSIVGACPVLTGDTPAGCSEPGGIWLLWPHPRCSPGSDLTCSALAHEACHLGLARGGGLLGGPVVYATEDQADACALLVNQEYRRGFDGQVFE